MVLKPKEAKEALDYWTNSPRQHPRKCIENSMENMHSDVRVRDVIKKQGYRKIGHF